VPALSTINRASRGARAMLFRAVARAASGAQSIWNTIALCQEQRDRRQRAYALPRTMRPLYHVQLTMWKASIACTHLFVFRLPWPDQPGSCQPFVLSYL
jgi:hypothetical protein